MECGGQVFTDAFSDPIHINITVDAVPGTKVFGESFPGLVSISYTDLFNQVVGFASTQNDAIAIGPGGSIIAPDPTIGDGKWQLTRAQAKAIRRMTEAPPIRVEPGRERGSNNQLTSAEVQNAQAPNQSEFDSVSRVSPLPLNLESD